MHRTMFPGYTVGADAYDDIAGVCEQYGRKAVIIGGEKALAAAKDKILKARATACIGDAYVGLEDYSAALGYFEKAADTIDNMYAAGYLLKAGAVCEKLGQKDQALAFYKRIKEQYPQSMEGYDIDKYISRIEAE